MESNTTSGLNPIHSTSAPPVTPSKFVRSTFVSEKIKVGAKRLIGRGDDDSLSNSSEVEDIFEDAAFNPQGVLDDHEREHDDNTFKDKLHRGAHGLVAIVKNPKRAMRSKTARTVAGNLTGGPYEQKYDAELVDAHDAFHTAVDNNDLKVQRDIDRRAHRGLHGGVDGFHSIKSVPGQDNSILCDMDEARARFQKVEEQRDSLQIAWVVGRHVKRIRAVKPMEHRPLRSEYTIASPDGRKSSVQWNLYLAQLALWHTRDSTSHHIDDFDELPFDLKDLSLTFERLVAVSAPWQSFLIELRNIYLWTNSKESLKYMMLYYVLCYFQQLTTAVLAWIIYATLMNRYSPSRIETIRKRAQRARDGQNRAQAWGELIQRYGKQDWVEPFLDEVGPRIQLELTDLSNLLEIASNFYRWETPRRTVRSLCVLVVCLLVNLFIDIKLFVRISAFTIGLIFFVSFPLSARYPKYRRLFNPIYWLFWDIPNLAEVAFTQLQEKASLRDAVRLERAEQSAHLTEDSSSSEDDSDNPLDNSGTSTQNDNEMDMLQAIQDGDHMSFRAVDSERRIRGRLTIKRHGISYHNKEIKSYYPYSQLLEVRKIKLGSINEQDTSRKARIARRIENSTSLRFLPSGIEFIFESREPPTIGPVLESQQDNRVPSKNIQLALTVSEADRHKIFSLVISWSNLRWQPQYTLNERHRLGHNADHPADVGKGSDHLDKTVKSFVE